MNSIEEYNSTSRTRGGRRRGTHRDGLRDESNAPVVHNHLYDPGLLALGAGNDAPIEPLVTAVLNPLPMFNAMNTQEIPRFPETPNHISDFANMSQHGQNEVFNFHRNYAPFFGQGEGYHPWASLPTFEFMAIPPNMPNNEANIYHRSSCPPSEGMVHINITSEGKDLGRNGARRLEAKYRGDVKSGFKYLQSSVENSRRVLRLKPDPPPTSRPKVLISASEILNYLIIKVQEQARMIQELGRPEESQISETSFDWSAEAG